MSEREPYAHRGHPTDEEQRLAREVAATLGFTITVLRDQGFAHDEAVTFIAGVAWEIGHRQGESWHSPQTAKLTIEGMLIGRAAKIWSIGMIEQALDEIKEML